METVIAVIERLFHIQRQLGLLEFLEFYFIRPPL